MNFSHALPHHNPLASQVLTLLMLSFRTRPAAVRDVLSRPCALLAALTCQAILMPMVTHVLLEREGCTNRLLGL